MYSTNQYSTAGPLVGAAVVIWMEVTDYRYSPSCSETVKKCNSTSGEGWTSPPSHIKSCTIWNMLTAVLSTQLFLWRWTFSISKSLWIHPFSSTYPYQGCGGPGACLGCQWARGGVHPGQVFNLMQGYGRYKWDIYSWSLTVKICPHCYCIHDVNSPSSLALKFLVTRVTQQPNANKDELLRQKRQKY